jgi:xanthine dehydrogenase small subunit
VESLRQDDGRLHPVQQALVDAHGSQCGFCTPGFVMSLFGLYKNASRPTRAQCASAISGNLCRCTGYRPILDAAHSMYQFPAPDDWRAPCPLDRDDRTQRHDVEIAGALQALRSDSALDYSAGGQRWIAPRSIDELAAACASHPDARIIAGATDLALRVTKQHQDLGNLIYIGDVQDLARSDVDHRAITIGAAVSLEHAFEALAQEWPETAEVWDRFASVPIRHSGTLAGNVANGSPIGDSMPVLIALGAQVELLSSAGSRVLPLESFYLAYQKTAREPGEVVARVRVPRRNADLKLRAYKVSKRYDQDISAVFACFVLAVAGSRIASARIGCGGVAPVPVRARSTEALLLGRPFEQATFERAAEALAREFTPIDDMRGSAHYRSIVLGNLLRRFWLECGNTPVQATRVDAVSLD